MVRHGFLVSIIVGSSPTTLDYKFVPDEIPGVGFKREQGVLGVGAVNKHDRAENHQGFRMS